MSELTALQGLRGETIEAVHAVQQALILAQSRAGASDVTFKEGRDVVTAADVAVEDAVRLMLTQAPGISVVGEERGGNATTDASYWLVDPICGTRNYASGMTLYCVNVALVEGSEVTIGVVGDPSTGEVLLAEHGHGAWALKGTSLRRLKTRDDSRMIVVEDGKSKGPAREHAARFMAEAVRADRWDFRSLGTSLSSPYFAAGRVSAYVVFYITDVHAAAGAIIASEGGGTLTDVTGAPWTVESDSLLVAATPALHADLLAMARATKP